MHFITRSINKFLFLSLSLLFLSYGNEPKMEATPAFLSNTHTLTILSNKLEEYLTLDLVAWGKDWKWFHFQPKKRDVDSKQLIVYSEGQEPNTGAKIQLKWQIKQSETSGLHLHYELTSDQEAWLTAIVVSVACDPNYFPDGTQFIVYEHDNTEKTVVSPLHRKGLGTKVKKVQIRDRHGEQVLFLLTPPTEISSDHHARITLAKERMEPGKTLSLEIYLQLPFPIIFYPSNDHIPDEEEENRWFPFTTQPTILPKNELSLASWHGEPAGKYGYIKSQNDKLIYNNKPIKLWGLNLCYGDCAPSRELAERRAKFYQAHGINAVRLHKYADGPGWAGILSKESMTQFDLEKLDRFDYQIHLFKQHGIFVKLSPSFGSPSIGPQDRAKIPYWKEFGSGGHSDFIQTGSGAFYLSEELQNLRIEQMVNLLKHWNPYTQLTYATDPCIAVIEIVNEESALFYGVLNQLQRSPTLRKRVGEKFFLWLEKKYGTKDRLLEAWGREILGSFSHERLVDESWESRCIYPIGNPWFWEPAQLEGSQHHRKRRLLDTAEFLYDLQNQVYKRIATAIREAGYQGEIVASNWIAGEAYSHYLNLHSDYLIGMIDRHNYFGKSGSMLSNPGSGILSIGMAQVINRPFMLSEWIHLWPNPWRGEGPAIIASYGMGLQDWDVSFMFQNRDEGSVARILGNDEWEVMAPQIIGTFPALSRMVHRGDVLSSPITAKLYVHIPSCKNGILDFKDKVHVNYDIKSFSTDKIPFTTLAVARVAVEFTENPQNTVPFDLTPYRTADQGLRSSTQQLTWYPGDSSQSGYFIIDTRGTKGLVGFAKNREITFSDRIQIKSSNPFVTLYLTAKNRDKDLYNDQVIILVVMARSKNTNMKLFAGKYLLKKGTSPVLLEPVKAEIRLSHRSGQFRVIPLDGDGVRTERSIPVSSDQRFVIDTGIDHTPYYLIEYF